MIGGTSYITASEEHYCDRELKQHARGLSAVAVPVVAQRLDELANCDYGKWTKPVSTRRSCRIRCRGFGSSTRDRRANDRLNEAVRAHPDRFAAFRRSQGAADELERTVGKLCFKGAMVNGLTNGIFLDDKRFWPIFERAQALDVPLYMHAAIPHPAVTEAYYKDYVEKRPGILRAGLGLHRRDRDPRHPPCIERVFDAYPRLKIILGRLGEGLPFYLWRISHGLRGNDGGKSFRDTFCDHFYVTTSGFFSDPACCAA